MDALVVVGSKIPAMSSEAIANVRNLESALLQMPQSLCQTIHTIHGGVYSRTVTVPENCFMTGALIKIPTTLIVNGHITVYLDGECIELKGYNILPASAGRKQAFFAHTATHITMVFQSDATTVAEAEAQFTDECDLLLSNTKHGTNSITITGE